jgi:hypothetical protein
MCSSCRHRDEDDLVRDIHNRDFDCDDIRCVRDRNCNRDDVRGIRNGDCNHSWHGNHRNSCLKNPRSWG